MPTLPGSCTPSRTRTTDPASPGDRRASRPAARRPRRRPAGVRCRPGVASSPSDTSTRGTARGRSAALRAPARRTFERRRDARHLGWERRRQAPLRRAGRLRRAPARGVRGRGAGAGPGSSSRRERATRCSRNEDRAHHRRLGFRRRRRHPGRPQDLPAFGVLRHARWSSRSPRRIRCGVRARASGPDRDGGGPARRPRRGSPPRRAQDRHARASAAARRGRWPRRSAGTAGARSCSTR